MIRTSGSVSETTAIAPAMNVALARISSMPMCSRRTAGMIPTAAPPKTLHASVTQPILRSRRSRAATPSRPPSGRARGCPGPARGRAPGTIARIASAADVEHADAGEHGLRVAGPEEEQPDERGAEERRLVDGHAGSRARAGGRRRSSCRRARGRRAPSVRLRIAPTTTAATEHEHEPVLRPRAPRAGRARTRRARSAVTIRISQQRVDARPTRRRRGVP